MICKYKQTSFPDGPSSIINSDHSYERMILEKKKWDALYIQYKWITNSLLF